MSRVGQFNFALRDPAAAWRESCKSRGGDDSRNRRCRARDEDRTLSAHLVPLQEQVTSGSRGALTLLFAAVGAVLLIVCVNLGNLMLVRANERARDAAICRALGADAGQLFRPVLTESLLIALSGGALGVLLAYAGVQMLVKTAPIDIPRLDEVHVSLTDAAIRFLRICRLRHPLRIMAGNPRNAGGACGRASIRLALCHRRPRRRSDRANGWSDWKWR